MVKIDRCRNNPLIIPDDIKPSREDFKVDGVFNCGVTEYNGEIILLCRIAESFKSVPDGMVRIPIVNKKEGKTFIDALTVNKKEHPEYDYRDKRMIKEKDETGMFHVKYLTSLSHLRIARAKDGISFYIEENPFIVPQTESECWGVEDPRITKISDTYYITYTAVSPNGAKTALISTKDFKSNEYHGIIFAPENKDVAIFPEKINGRFLAFNRPVPSGIGYPDMWLAASPDLIHWGEQKYFYGVSENGWENGRIGVGAVPFLTDKGWITIYHAADRQNRYCLGAFLLDKEDPSKILAKTIEPLLEPLQWYEKEGYFENVVFTCGCIYNNGIVNIYYGAADNKVCRADIRIEEIYKSLHDIQ